MRRADAACALTTWQHFSVRNDVMAAIMKLYVVTWEIWLRHLREEQSCQISSRSVFKYGGLSIFEQRHPNKKKDNKLSSSDVKIETDPPAPVILSCMAPLRSEQETEDSTWAILAVLYNGFWCLE